MAKAPKKRTEDDDEDVELTRRSQPESQKLEHMLAVLIRHPEAHQTAHDLLPVQALRVYSEAWGLIWKVVRKFYSVHASLPTRSQLTAELSQRLASNPGLLANEDSSVIDSFLAYAYSQKQHGDIDTDQHYRVALDTCKQLLEDRLAIEIQNEVFRNGTIPLQLPTVMSEFTHRAELIGSISEAEVEQVFKPGWDKKISQKLTTTGDIVLDDFLGNGDAAGEVHLFMAPYGTCKTLLAVKLCCERARLCQALYLSGSLPPGEKPCVIFVSAEMDMDEFRRRCLTYLACLPTERLDAMVNGIESLSKTRKPGALPETRYEYEIFDRELAKYDYRSEYDRAQDAVKLVNEYIYFINFTDSNERNPHAGTGGMREAANIVAGLVRKNKGLKPLGFYIDHLAAMVDRMMASGIYEEREAWNLLKRGPL